MKVGKNMYVALDYTLSLDSGEVIDKSEGGEPLGFIFGTGQIIPGLERGIEGLEEGESTRVTVEPEEAYGPKREELIQEIPLANFPSDVQVKPGMAFQTMGPQGPVTFMVTAVQGDSVTADFNHPLAGERLHFEITVREVREPTPEEIASLLGAASCDPSGCGTCGGGCA